MKNPRNLLLVAAAAALFTLAGCQSDENPMQPRAVDFNGAWSGPFTHPAYDSGTLTLTLAQVRADSISGTFHLRLNKVLANGLVRVENYGGNITEARRSGDAGLSFALRHTEFTWDGTGSSPQDGRITGTWRSRISAGISGTFDATRN